MDLLSPRNIQTAGTIDHARELVDAVVTSDDGDEIADRFEAAAGDADLANAVMFMLLARLRGWPEERTGVEFVADSMTPAVEELWIP